MTSPTKNSLIGVWGTAWNNVYAAGEKGTILHYDGKSWTQQASGTTFFLNEVWGLSAGRVYALGDKGLVLTRSGSAWTDMQQHKIYEQLFGIWGKSEKELWVVGASGTILRFDGGVWSSMSITSGTLKSVWGSGSDNVYIVGFVQGGVVMRYDGQTWTSQNIHPEPVSSLWAASATDLFIAGGWNNGGLVLRNQNASAGWKAMNLPAGPWLSGIHGRSVKDVVAVGNSGRLLEFDGAQWSVVNPLTTKRLFSVWVSPSGTAYVVGIDGVILKR